MIIEDTAGVFFKACSFINKTQHGAEACCISEFQIPLSYMPCFEVLSKKLQIT